MRRIPDDIAERVLDWIDEQVPTPDGPPCVNASIKLEAVHDFLIGAMRGSEGPTSGTRTYAMDVKFHAAPGTEQSAIDLLLAGLRWAASEEPHVAGLPNGGRLFLGAAKVEAEKHRNLGHAGPIITLAAQVRVPEG